MKDHILGEGTIEWLGVLYKTILTPDETKGAMSIVDTVSPAKSGPPRHIHHNEDECFILLSGECMFWVAGQTFYRSAGQTAFVPRGTEHTFQVVGTQPCRHLIILTPGGFEGFFAEMAKGKFRIPEDMAAIGECAERFGLSFTGPPLAVAV